MSLQSVNKKKVNYKLNRSRGLGWEDDLTRHINEKFMLTDAYNLGGSTAHVPDIVTFSRYHYDFTRKPQSLHKIRISLDDDNKNRVTEDPPKFITNPFIMVIECKFTIDKSYIIPKEGVDKGFEFLRNLEKYDRFVMLAFKFKTGKAKNKTIFVLLKYNHYFLMCDYDFFRCDVDGTFGFYHKGVNQHKPARLHDYLNSKGFGGEQMKSITGLENLKLDEL